MDWRAAAEAVAPDIPEDQVERIVPILETLERAFEPVVERLPFGSGEL
jgi:hypothetical protein